MTAGWFAAKQQPRTPVSPPARLAPRIVGTGRRARGRRSIPALLHWARVGQRRVASLRAQQHPVSVQYLRHPPTSAPGANTPRCHRHCAPHPRATALLRARHRRPPGQPTWSAANSLPNLLADPGARSKSSSPSRMLNPPDMVLAAAAAAAAAAGL